MPRYAALLGSINVGGNRVKMADLKAAFERAGFANVSTVSASGNVLFEHDISSALEQRIAELVVDEIGIETFAVVRSGEEMASALAESPFVGMGEDKLVHVMFLEDQPDACAFAQLEQDHAARGTEKLAAGTRALHIDYDNGVGNSKLTKQFIEKRLGCRGTARNVSSLRRILEKMK